MIDNITKSHFSNPTPSLQGKSDVGNIGVCVRAGGKAVATLFDLDGVVFDTEPQYTVFWGGVMRKFRPDVPGLEYTIKGSTLTRIFEDFLPHVSEEYDNIVKGLNEFEKNMDYPFVEGFEDFVKDCRRNGLKTAVVTSSNKAKMDSVLKKRPELTELMDAILMSEDFEFSKPHPDCYIKGAQRFGAKPEECLVFEDSFNGLKSGRASGAVVVGLSTSNSEEAIREYCDIVIPNYKGIDYKTLISRLK